MQSKMKIDMFWGLDHRGAYAISVMGGRRPTSLYSTIETSLTADTAFLVLRMFVYFDRAQAKNPSVTRRH